MEKLTPYLMYNGVCEEAMNFYKECFNGEIVNMGRYGDSPMEVPESHKTKIVHVEFRFWEVHSMPLTTWTLQKVPKSLSAQESI